MKRLVLVVGSLFSSLAAASLLVSAERGSDEPIYVGAPSRQDDSAIAWGAGIGLTAWRDGRGGVYVARVDGNHQLLDEGGIRLGEGERPDVAFDGTNFLVVWQHTVSGNSWDIFAARVSLAGTLLDPTPIVVSNAPNAQIAPAVAFSDGVFLVVWQDARSGGSTYEFVFGARIATDGTVLDPNGLLICQAPNSRAWPDVAGGDDDFLVVWADGRTSSDPRIYGARVTSDGVVREPNGVALSQAGNNVWDPAVAFDGTNYWVAYARVSSSTSYSGSIRAFRVTTDLQVLDPAVLDVSGNSSWDRVPNLACGGGYCLVVWNHDDQYSTGVRGVRVRADGTIFHPTNPHSFGTAPSAILSGNQRRFGVAWTGSAFVTTWHEQNRYQTSGGRGLDVYQRRLATDGSWVDAAPLRVSSAANYQTTPSVAFNGNDYLVAWVDDRHDTQDIFAARFDQSGNILDPAGIAISTGSGNQTSPSVAAIGGDFVVIWSDDRGGSGWDLYAARIAPDGTVRDPSGIPVSTTSGDQTEPRLACSATECLAVWLDTRTSTGPDLYGSRLSPSGAVLDIGGVPIHTQSGSAHAPAVAFNGTEYLVAWGFWPNFGSDSVYARRMTTAGAFVDATPLSVIGNDSAYKLSAAAVDEQFLLGWISRTRTLKVAQIPPAGAPAILSTVGSTQLFANLVLASDGAEVLALWSLRSTSGQELNLWARHLDTNGAPVDGPFQVLDLTPQYHESAPALASRSAREWLLAYNRTYQAKPLGNTRVAVRTLSPLEQGSVCTGDRQCASGFCVDGVCCESACGGGAANDCQACSVATGAAVDGQCAPLVQGTVCRTSAGVCDAAEVCDGAAMLCPDDAAAADGTHCDDGNACTRTDSCLAGACVGGDPVTCEAQSACHEVGVCNPATGVCSQPLKSNGAPCDDGDACTQTDSCQAGVCRGTNPVTCIALSQCHLAGVCDPASGLCSDPPKPDGSACNDGDRCTRTDTCLSGVCIGADEITCTASDQCHDAGECDAATGVCSNPPKPDGSACDDQNACTQTDSCQAGLCEGANPVTCSAKSQCHDVGVCSPSTGVCSEPPKVNGASCDDGDLCTRSDRCESGVCRGTEPVRCVAIDQCHDAGVCDPSTGRCSNLRRPDGAPCDDGNACTESDTCQNGVCTGANPKVCSSENECEEAVVCTDGACSFLPRADGTPCSLGACKSGVCEAPPPPDPPDSPDSPDAATATPSGCGCGSVSDGSLLLAAPLLAAFLSRRRARERVA